MHSSGEHAQNLERRKHPSQRILLVGRIYDGLECEITPRAHVNLDQL